MRHSAIPPMPKDPRRELDLLRDDTGPLGFLLWRIISDVLLWTGCPPADRAGLFRDAPEGRGEPLAYATLAAPELREPLRVLLTVSVTPELADASAVAEACAKVVEWAEGQDMKETAVQFAEAAARLESNVSRRAYTAGRLCRRLGDHPRAAIWFRRAMRLARRTQTERIKYSEVDFTIAQIGYSKLLIELGRSQEAEPHLWKAVRAATRAGRTSLAGAAHHDLLLITVRLARWPEALEHAKQAVRLYKDGHPRFPLLAYDVAFMWSWLGYFSSALPIFEKILPFVELQRERILVLASLARSAAVVRDHIRYVRASDEVLRMAAQDTEMAASSLYHIAHGAQSFQQWDRAKELATRALDIAHERSDSDVIELSERLLMALHTREPGNVDMDMVPDEGGIVDATREMILRKLQKQPAPELSSGAVRPEQYPTDGPSQGPISIPIPPSLSREA
jgi:tetratricopeptide (TPR) repeat protein